MSKSKTNPDPETRPDTGLPASSRSRSERDRLALVFLCGLLVGAAVLIFVFTRPGSWGSNVKYLDSTAHADHSYVIPLGTQKLIDSGQKVDLLPNPLIVKVGDVIRITNNDTSGFAVGPFYVGANQTVTQTFTKPGTLKGECAIHPSGSLVVEIRP